MRNLKKKGFTIVELVIVIAVIAVLAAVLIPTFVNLTRKANVSADTVLVKNLNTSLSSDVKEHKTMHDALEAAKANGYDIAKIQTKANGNKILWDSKNDCFVYLDSDKDKIVYIPDTKSVDVENKDLWIISNNVSDTYSTYLYGYEGTEVNAKLGLDTGDSSIEKVVLNTNAAGELTIRTNGGVLELNAANATVNHYGSASEVYVINVADSTYNLYGNVGYIEVENSEHVVLKQGSSVSAVYAPGNNVELENGQEDVVYTSGNKEEIKESATKFAGGLGTEENPYLITNVEQFKNIDSLYEKGFYSFKIADGIDALDLSGWESVRLNGNFDGNGIILNNLDKGLFDCVDGESSTIENFTINVNIISSGGVGAVVYDSNTLNLTIDSVNVHGTIIGANWVTPYVEFGPGASYAWNLTIKNSISDATLVATSGSASGFVGHPYNDVSNGSVNGASLITIIDSAYIGNMSATGSVTGNNFKYFTINGNDNRVKTHYSNAFIQELGYNPEGTLYKIPTDVDGFAVINNEDGSKTFFCGNYGKNVVDNYKLPDKKAQLNTTAQAVLPENIGDTFVIKKATGAVKAVISLQIAPNDKNNYGSYLGTYMTEEIDISSITSGATFNSENVKYFAINVNSEVTSTTGVSGNIFNVVNSAYGKNAHNGAVVKIVQFDTNGNVLNITSVQIADPSVAE